jgi:hypothetical protein
VSELLAAHTGHDERYYAHLQRAIAWAEADAAHTERHYDVFLAALAC